MTNGALRTSAIALGAAAFAMLSTIPAADAATAVHHYGHVAHARVGHARVAHGHVYGHVARARAGTRHYVWRNGRRYAYGAGYNPGAAVAAGVIGGVLGGLAGGYPYSCDYSYYGPYDSCGYYGVGDGYWPYYGYGYGPYYGGYGGYGG